MYNLFYINRVNTQTAKSLSKYLTFIFSYKNLAIESLFEKNIAKFMLFKVLICFHFPKKLYFDVYKITGLPQMKCPCHRSSILKSIQKLIVQVGYLFSLFIKKIAIL